MDTRNGNIIDPDEARRIHDEALKDGADRHKKQLVKFLKQMEIRPTVTQMHRKPPRIEPYEPCGCGSGKKFKFCCRAKGR